VAKGFLIEMSIDSFFNPRGVAVVGSTAHGKIGYELVRQIREGGFEQLYAVNPKAQGVFDAPGYVSVRDIPQPVDLAVIASPAPTVAAVLEECGQAGIKAVVIITSGFSEVGNQAGEAEIKQIARKHGLRLVGPNCAGLVNTHHKLFASLETRPPQGEVAFISQSGALGGAVLSWAEDQGLGFSKFISYGNRSDLDEIDLLPYLAQDPETKVGALYIESVADGAAFMQAVRDFTRHKPLVVIKSGRSQSGRRAALSHTGSMAGADAVYDAALKACGALRVDSVEEMFDLCQGFVRLAPVRGRRIAIVTNSGGPGVLAADRAEALGLQVAEPTPALREKLLTFLPAHCSLKNPIDLTVEGTETSYRETLSAVLEDYDAALALDVSTPYLDTVALARGVCAAAEKSGKPVVANFMAGRIVAEGVAYLKAHGLPNFATGERAVAVLARMAQHTAHVHAARLPEIAPSGKGLPGVGALLEPEAMAWLGENGLPAPKFRWVPQREAVGPACLELGYPVVMKVVSPDILHKSESGGVKLDIRDETAAQAAFDAIRQAAAGKDFRGVVVYPMLRGAQEVLMGLSRDPQFGPVVMFGLGGIYTEVLRDISLRVAPVDRPEAEAMLREIRAFPILEGVRGQPGCDLAALAETLVNFSRLPFLYPEVAEIDLNPVFVRPQGLVIGDARVIRR
jgi:acetate---CoA ligase (ADP-forming)